MGERMITVERLSKRFEKEFQVIEDLNFSLDNGHSMAVIGPSGCGKTTLLYILAGLTRQTSGTVLIDGRSVEGPSPEVSFILQDFGLFPWKTVIDNVCLGMKLRGVSVEERILKAEPLLEELGLAQHRDHFPARLSGGERQRVAIARALVTKPMIVLADEPTANLDSVTGEAIIELMKKVNADSGTTFVFSTHDDKVVRIADHVVRLRDGLVVENSRRS